LKEHWNSRYNSDEYVYGKEPNEFFKEELAKLKPGKLLLPADGEGRNGVFAAGLGWEVTSFDWSDEGKKKAEKLAGSNGVNINYIVTEASQFNFPENEFDAVGLVFVHLPEEEREELHRKLHKKP
jgi:Methyltransferase domain.